MAAPMAFLKIASAAAKRNIGVGILVHTFFTRDVILC
jgi:NADH:ubiquinone oxidoreductase subunit K